MLPETEAARFYDTFGASLFRYALMILANREAAEDVIQQVFLALLDRRTGRLEDEERFLPECLLFGDPASEGPDGFPRGRIAARSRRAGAGKSAKRIGSRSGRRFVSCRPTSVR